MNVGQKHAVDTPLSFRQAGRGEFDIQLRKFHGLTDEKGYVVIGPRIEEFFRDAGIDQESTVFGVPQTVHVNLDRLCMIFQPRSHGPGVLQVQQA